MPLFLLSWAGKGRTPPYLSTLHLLWVLSMSASPLSTLLIFSPPTPLHSFVYISETLVQVKHGFLINTFPLIAGKKISRVARSLLWGSIASKPLLSPTPALHLGEEDVLWGPPESGGRAGCEM